MALSHGSGVQSLAVLKDGRLASGGVDGTIKLWLVDEEKLIATLCLRAGRNLTRAMGGKHHQVEAVRNLVDAILDGHAGH